MSLANKRLPDSWSWSTLWRKLGRSLTYGIVQAGPDFEGGVPYIRPVDMTAAHGIKDSVTLRKTDPEIAQAYARAAVKPGELILTIGPSYGKVMIVPDEFAGANLTQGTARVVPGDAIEPRYLYWVFQSQVAKDYWATAVGGATFGGLNLGPLADTPVPVPPLEEQRRIADYLDTETARIDTLITKNEQAATLVEERRVAYIEHTFWQDSFDRLPLEYVCDPRRPIRYGIVLPGPSVDDGVPLIKGGDVHRQTLSDGTDSRVDRELEAGHTKSRVKPGDLVYTIRGSYGDVAAVPDTMDFANLTQDVARVAPKTVLRDWLRYVLDAPSARSYADVVATGATIKGVNIGELRKMPVPVASEGEQERLVREADSVTGRLRDILDNLRHQRDLLIERRQALITAAVTGEIEV